MKLKDFNFAKDNISDLLNNDYILRKNTKYLENIYSCTKEKADSLTMLDEYVGNTYENLNKLNDYISSVKKENVLKKVAG